MRWVIKLGSGLLVDAEGLLQLDVVESIVKQVVELLKSGAEVLLVSSGAVACGVRQLGYTSLPTSLRDRQA